jgi:pimeloyl-ACP methyl ester carboxylesterase
MVNGCRVMGVSVSRRDIPLSGRDCLQPQTALSTYPTRRSFLATSVGVLASSSLASAQPAPPAASKTGYAPVNGLKMYYEIHGSGEPLVLIHGGVVGITMFGPNVEALAKGRQVIAVELQGHGHTADIDRPMSCEAMADDIAALIQYLGLQKADVMGYSLGGYVALQTVIRHPQSVRKLVVVSAGFRRSGMYPEVLAAFDKMNASTGEQMNQSPLSKMYPNVNWQTLFGKLGEMLRKDYDWSKEVAAIHSPTMLVFADADAVRLQHIVEFYSLLGGGQRDAGLDGSLRSVNELAILPGLTHYNLSAAPVMVETVTPFLDAAMPPAR